MSSESIEEFRQEVVNWIEENLPQEIRVGNRQSMMGLPVTREWIKKLTDRGWVCPEWPVEYGGAGLDRKQAAVVKAELASRRAPMVKGFGTQMIGPTLLEFGTEEQKLEFLPKIARNEMNWCQGYSEPGAGSDLASLQTRAVRDGDEYVVTGQKIWTSYAHAADWIF